MNMRLAHSFLIAFAISFSGSSFADDIVEAGSRACLEVTNRILRRRQRSTSDIESTARMERATI